MAFANIYEAINFMLQSSLIFFNEGVWLRNCSRIFERVVDETTFACGGKNPLIYQTYQNYEQSRQKLGTFVEDEVLVSPIFIKEKKPERFNQFSTLKNNFENRNFDIFEKAVHNFGKSEDDKIY